MTANLRTPGLWSVVSTQARRASAEIRPFHASLPDRSNNSVPAEPSVLSSHRLKPSSAAQVITARSARPATSIPRRV
ncbi:hypothetical protein ACFQ2Y_02460 [Streptomyces malaysiensis subsp. malaysiensis]